jgi:uncharacterized protein YbbK (DUF523 family)
MTYETAPLRIGISACLLGENVRYDGGNKRDRVLVDTFGQHVECVPICPEVECGMTVPREPMRLVCNPGRPRLVTIETGVDHTDRMYNWSEAWLAAFADSELCGCIFKSRSPSCGMERIKVYTGEGEVIATSGTGIWARMVMDRFPLLPVEDEESLRNPLVRDRFIERVFEYQRSSYR